MHASTTNTRAAAIEMETELQEFSDAWQHFLPADRIFMLGQKSLTVLRMLVPRKVFSWSNLPENLVRGTFLRRLLNHFTARITPVGQYPTCLLFYLRRVCDAVRARTFKELCRISGVGILQIRYVKTASGKLGIWRHLLGIYFQIFLHPRWRDFTIFSLHSLAAHSTVAAPSHFLDVSRDTFG